MAELPFPIIEAFGFPVDSAIPAAKKARDQKWCPFAGTPCEKWRQYRFGYCSVQYAAADDERRRRVYAVCDHRLDGPPVRRAIQDHFGDRSDVHLVPEIVLTKPRTSFDYVAFTIVDGAIADAIAIEAQAIDIRGGGVGPAWRAWLDGKQADWRSYFTEEAKKKGRKDNVAYGVNMANIYKRLGLQVAEKGAYLKRIGVPLYVVMQDRPFQYLRRRIPFEIDASSRDVTFMTFDYTGRTGANSQLEFPPVQTVRTSLELYTEALMAGSRSSESDRKFFLDRVKRKARLGD